MMLVAFNILLDQSCLLPCSCASRNLLCIRRRHLADEHLDGLSEFLPTPEQLTAGEEAQQLQSRM